jgi:hypothetical protein
MLQKIRTQPKTKHPMCTAWPVTILFLAESRWLLVWVCDSLNYSEVMSQDAKAKENSLRLKYITCMKRGFICLHIISFGYRSCKSACCSRTAVQDLPTENSVHYVQVSLDLFGYRGPHFWGNVFRGGRSFGRCLVRYLVRQTFCLKYWQLDLARYFYIQCSFCKMS